MRRAGLIVWQAHQVAAEIVRAGVTTGEIDQAVEDVFTRWAVEPLFQGVTTEATPQDPAAKEIAQGPVPFPAVTCISVNEAIVHGIPGDRVLEPGDIVSIDTGCKLNGWCGDAAVTHAVGQISDEARRLLEVTQGVLELAIEQMGRARLWSEVAAEMEAYVRKAGCTVIEDFVGHGVGRDMHEEPQVPNYFSEQFKREGDFDLRPGLVIAIEPMICTGAKKVRVLADHWTQVTADGSLAAHFEHTVALTSSGPCPLTGPPQTDEERDFLAGVSAGAGQGN